MRCHVRRMVLEPQVIHVATTSKVALALSCGVDNQNAVARWLRAGDDPFVLHVLGPPTARADSVVSVRSQQPTGLESNAGDRRFHAAFVGPYTGDPTALARPLRRRIALWLTYRSSGLGVRPIARRYSIPLGACR
jgi:hypothetical protein